jgi:hypothetical protein
MSDASAGDLPPLPTFPQDAQVCGNCKLWRPHSVDHRGWVGPCRVQDNRGLFPPSAPVCNAYVPKSGAAAPAPVSGRVPAGRAARSVAPVVVRRRPDPDTLVDLGDLQMTRQELIDLIREATNDAEPPALAPKWEGGTLRMVPGKAELQAKELPIDALFHKVVMVRDRLRVLEQKLNAHPGLSDAEKVELQGYITRVYGSLTSFNLLFRDRDDQFVGAKSED